MMRQAVPLITSRSPIVGTGLERQVASDSRVLINAGRKTELLNMLMLTLLLSNTTELKKNGKF